MIEMMVNAFNTGSQLCGSNLNQILFQLLPHQPTVQNFIHASQYLGLLSPGVLEGGGDQEKSHLKSSATMN